MPKYGETLLLDYCCNVKSLGCPPHLLVANKLMPFDSKQCSQAPVIKKSILHASTLVIAQHADLYRKIGRIQVLYNFNFVGIDMREKYGIYGLIVHM